MLDRLLDTVLDRTVIPGYSAVGVRVRRRLPGWDASLPRMEGKQVVVTGATAGLGLAAARGFAELGAAVVLIGRDAARGEAARADVAAAARGGEVRLELADVSSLASVRALAPKLGAVDVLVHNAGVLLPERRLTAEGLEATFATNVLGPFLLSRLLEPVLRERAPARVIWVASGGMYTQRLAIDDLQAEQLAQDGDWDGSVVYARTKRAEVILCEEFASRLRDSGVVVHAMHPGWADTPGVVTSIPRFHRFAGPLLRSAEEGADTIVWLGAAEEPGRTSGQFWHDRRVRPTHYMDRTRETPADRAALWAACERLAGLTRAD